MRKKSLLLVLAIPIALQLVNLFYLHFDGTFKPKTFAHGFKKSYATQVSELDFSQLNTIFAQPFHQLGHGKQMIALESEDGKYVLKLFNPMRPLKKKWHMRWKYWKRYSSLKWISREWFQKKARLKKLFTRHKLAYELLQNETGLIFVHLSPSKQVCHYVHVTDKQGKKHIIALEKTPFVLQEKAVLVPSHMEALLRENRIDDAKKAVARLEALFEKRLQVGITDRIQTMENNYGFVGNKPIQIDVGRIRVRSDLQKNPSEEKMRILNNFHTWLTQNYPHCL